MDGPGEVRREDNEKEEVVGVVEEGSASRTGGVLTIIGTVCFGGGDSSAVMTASESCCSS